MRPPFVLRSSFLFFSLIALFSVLLGACGQSGSLYLPDKKEAEASAMTATPPATSAPATPATAPTSPGSQPDEEEKKKKESQDSAAPPATNTSPATTTPTP